MVKKRVNISEKLTAIDFFGQGVTFNTDGKSQVNSFLGTLMSILIIVITLVYAESRFTILRRYGDTTYQTVAEPRKDGSVWYN